MFSFVAICTDFDIKIFEKPSIFKKIEKCLLYKKYKGKHNSKIISIDWSPDSRFIASTSLDLTVQIHNIHPIKNYIAKTFTGFKEPCLKSFFQDDMQYVKKF